MRKICLLLVNKWMELCPLAHSFLPPTPLKGGSSTNILNDLLKNECKPPFRGEGGPNPRHFKLYYCFIPAIEYRSSIYSRELDKRGTLFCPPSLSFVFSHLLKVPFGTALMTGRIRFRSLNRLAS